MSGVLPGEPAVYGPVAPRRGHLTADQRAGRGAPAVLTAISAARAEARARVSLWRQGFHGPARSMSDRFTGAFRAVVNERTQRVEPVTLLGRWPAVLLFRMCPHPMGCPHRS